MTPTACVVGTGLTAAVATNELLRNGWEVTMVEAQQKVGGNVVPATINGLFFEPDGPHIIHTENQEAAAWLGFYVKLNGYVHRVVADTEIGYLAWPPQVNELKNTILWPQIRAELTDRPKKPDPTNFETYAVGLMGRTLYHLFIRDYTRKQWGREPYELASSFAPKRIDLRTDDYLPLFRDALQGWPLGGWQPVIERLLRGVTSIQLGYHAVADSIEPSQFTAVLVTCPLDDFLGDEPLEWRGIRTESVWYPSATGNQLPAPTVNCPSPDVPYTRISETPQMSGQTYAQGTVLTYEFPGAKARHYPVDDAAGVNRQRANDMRKRLTTDYGYNVVAAGRLATYSYINMDQAIVQGLHAARKMKDLA
jgi:UDP-galactopyranose mutase